MDVNNEGFFEPVEQEPVAVVDVHEFYDNCANFSLLQKLPKGNHTLYATPPQRKPLTDEEIWKAIRPLIKTDQLCKRIIDISMDEYRAIEAAHGIKENT